MYLHIFLEKNVSLEKEFHPSPTARGRAMDEDAWLLVFQSCVYFPTLRVLLCNFFYSFILIS